MCGICGEFRFDGGEPDVAALDRMMEVLVPRGPDSGDKKVIGSLALGHRRLAIIDLSERGAQPMQDKETGHWLVFNGTIYNYRELRQQLAGQGHRFISESDTEVILKAYAQWGTKCVEHFVGMFAFVLWDVKQQTLFMARDRLGIKPLYYSRDSQRIRFASNPQALLAAGDVDTSFDAVALHHHLTLHAVVPAPRTILSGVRKLPPATSLILQSNGKSEQYQYWNLTAQRPAEKIDEQEWIDRVHTSLRLAVDRRRLAADVPVGVLLSGGLDSSLLVALLCEAGQDDLQTFSVGFEDQPEEKGSEFEFSDQVVERYQTQHHKIHIPNDQVLKRLPEAVQYMAEPMFGQDAVAFFLLSEQVSQHVKVVQSGQGADEVFAGYFWYSKMVEDINGEYTDRFARYYFDREHEEYLQTVANKYHGEDYTRQKIASLLNEPDADEFIDRILRMDVTTLVIDDPVKRVDNMTMAFGLEARVPFLDSGLVELAAQMPPHMKLGSGGKHVLKEISRGLLPDAVIDRPKGYFPMPALKYVRGEFLDFMRGILLSDTARQRGLYQSAYVEKLLSEPDQHFTRLQGSKLWHLALLELWLQTHLG